MVFIDPQKAKTTVVALKALGNAKTKLMGLTKKGFDAKQKKTVKTAATAIASFYDLAAKAKHDETKCIKACKKASKALDDAFKLKPTGDISKTWGVEVARYQKLLDMFPT